MDINPEISNWVLEFLLRQPLEDGVLNSLLRSLPLSNDNAHLKKMILLRKIDSDLSGSSISESTLEVFEKLEELEFQQGLEAVSDAMKRAYCAVAVECTVQFLGDNGDGGTDSRKFKFFEVVKRVWKGRIGRMEKMVERGGLGSDELWRWKEEMEAAVWEDSVFEGVVKKSEGVNAVEAIRDYMREEKEKMGPSFLELVADSVKDDKATPGVPGVESRKEGQAASAAGVSSVDMGMESGIGDDGQPQSSDELVPPPISPARRKSGRKTTRKSYIGDDDQPQSSDEPVPPISPARRKSGRKPTRMSDIGDDGMESDIGDDGQPQSSDEPVPPPISSARRKSGRTTTRKSYVGDDDQPQSSDESVPPISLPRRKSGRKTTRKSYVGDDDQPQSSDELVPPISSPRRKSGRKSTRMSDIDNDGLQSSNQPVRRRNGRKSAVCMTKFNLKKGGKVKVHFDSLLDASGPNKGNTDNFISYLGFLGRKLVSILLNSWNDVSDDNKENIWQAILDKFEFFFLEDQNEVEFSLVDVKKQNNFKKKWVSYVGRRWASFKTYLTRNYIYGNKKGQLPYEDDYPFLDADTWDAFVASRLTEEFKEKREQAQKSTSHNKCPHRCSRGGYKALKQKIMEEKYKARHEASEDPLDVIPPPSPPSLHEVWKRARISVDGKYTTPEASIIAEKIGKLRADMLSSQVGATSAPETPVVQSAKGSFAPVFMAEDLHEEHDNYEYELYVEDPNKRLVAYGRLHDLRPIIHHKKLKADEARVTVVKVVVGDARVPIPTDEVTTVGEATNQFITWPRRLLQNVAHKGISQPKNLDPKPQSRPETSADVLKRLWVVSADITEPKYMCMEGGIVGEKTDHGVHISQDDIMGLLLTRQISVSVMDFYNKYLHNVIKLSGRVDRYGLMSPLTIKSRTINEEIGVFLRKRIGEGDLECFLVPIYEDYWQLMVLCPKYNVVTWFCPMGKKQKRKLSEKIETAFEAYQVMKGMKTYKSKKPQWIYPKCYLQKGSAIEAFGFFVMRLMLEIIKLDIVNSFEKALDMEELYSKDNIDDVRRHWAECFLEVTSR